MVTGSVQYVSYGKFYAGESKVLDAVELRGLSAVLYILERVWLDTLGTLFRMSNVCPSGAGETFMYDCWLVGVKHVTVYIFLRLALYIYLYDLLHLISYLFYITLLLLSSNECSLIYIIVYIFSIYHNEEYTLPSVIIILSRPGTEGVPPFHAFPFCVAVFIYTSLSTDLWSLG